MSQVRAELDPFEAIEAWCRELLLARENEIQSLEKKIERLRTVVDKLPKTADGVPIVPGMEVWLPGSYRYPGEVERDAYGVNPCVDWPEALYHPCQLYSSREAARAAAEDENESSTP